MANTYTSTGAPAVLPTSYCTLADVKQYAIGLKDTVDDTEISALVPQVSRWLDFVSGWSFFAETRTDEERSYPEVIIDNDGRLNVRVDKCPITAVLSLAYRFQPQNSWSAVDASVLEIYPTPATAPRAERAANLIRAYVDLSAARITYKPRVKLTYTAGWVTIPANLNFLAMRLTYWRYKQRSAPFEKTANPALGTLIIPAQLPPDLKGDLVLWKRWA